VLLPASTRGQGGLDELFEQTRSILTMRAEKPTAVFGKQMAFNLLPASADRDRNLVLLRRLLGGDCEVALQLVQAGVFHSLACGLFVQFDTDPGIEQLRTALASNPAIDIAEQGDRPGPTDVAAREEILVADLLASSSTPGSYQLWAVMDNLTRGGVLNLMEIVESLVVPGS
jgi:aspartate-semialdehyde dehydrogenase